MANDVPYFSEMGFPGRAISAFTFFAFTHTQGLFAIVLLLVLYTSAVCDSQTAEVYNKSNKTKLKLESH